MTTYAWTEHQMVVAPSEAGLTNVVKRVLVIYTADDGVNTASQLMNVELDPPDPENFTAFASLTEVQINGWVEAKVDETYWQGHLDDMLLSQTFVSMECPWD